MMRTSRPYALCHQSSKGADTSIAKPPHAERNAPAGPEKPKTRMLTSRSAAARPNVATAIRYPDEMPARMPHA